MRVVIIEDEIPSQRNLRRALATIADDLTVVKCLESVAESVAWFNQNPSGADLVFMDVQLADGLCFEIFQQCKVPGKVVITTAYDAYALDAFKIHSIDYLLKPIDMESLRGAVNHCRTLSSHGHTLDYAVLAELLDSHHKPQYKERFLVKVGDKILVVGIDSISLFYSENKTTYLVTDQQREYILDESLDAIEAKLNPQKFFRIGRSCIVALDYIQVVTKHFGSRLKVQLKQCSKEDLFVSRARTAEFLDWMSGK